jgi:hypothetical protein
MTAARYLTSIGFLALASACVGTIDSLHYVQGEAPSSAGCEVLVSEAGSSHEKAREKVSGSFRVGYTAGGPFPSDVDIAAYCDGVKVKELKGVSPRQVGNTNLGKLAP